MHRQVAVLWEPLIFLVGLHGWAAAPCRAQASLESLTFDPNPVVGGKAATATIKISYPPLPPNSALGRRAIAIRMAFDDPQHIIDSVERLNVAPGVPTDPTRFFLTRSDQESVRIKTRQVTTAVRVRFEVFHQGGPRTLDEVLEVDPSLLAQLTFVDLTGRTVGNGTDVTVYVGVRLPDGETVRHGGSGIKIDVGVLLDLKVQFPGSTTWVDVTKDPNTHFLTIPERLPNPLDSDVFECHFTDAGRDFTVLGRYTDPRSGVSATGSGVVRMRLFDAPVFFNAGPGQERLLSELDQFTNQVLEWLSETANLSSASGSAILAHLATIRVLLEVWDAAPVASHVIAVGNALKALHTAQALLVQLSYLSADMGREEVVGFMPDQGPLSPCPCLGWNLGGTGFFPAWLLPRPVVIAWASPAIPISWLDLGDVGDW